MNCKYCQSENIIKYGKYKNTQYYYCKDCKRKFAGIDTIHSRMAHDRPGWWFSEKPAPEQGCFESNINVVTTDDPPGEEICTSVRTRGTLCRIYK